MKLTDSFPPSPDPQGNLRPGRRAASERPAGSSVASTPPRGASGGATPSLRLVGERGQASTDERGGRSPANDARPATRPHGAPRADGYRRSLDPFDQARRAVTQSNVEAAYDASLDPQDPRWLVAVETATALEGSLLTFERRRKVLAFAHRVGVRPFDANLIIAAVQDRARRGEPLSHAVPTIALTSPPRRRVPWLRRILSRQALPYLATAFVAVAVHAVGIGLALWLLLG